MLLVKKKTFNCPNENFTEIENVRKEGNNSEGFLSKSISTVYKTNLVRDIKSILDKTNYTDKELSEDSLAYTTIISNIRKITSRNSKSDSSCFEDKA